MKEAVDRTTAFMKARLLALELLGNDTLASLKAKATVLTHLSTTENHVKPKIVICNGAVLLPGSSPIGSDQTLSAAE